MQVLATHICPLRQGMLQAPQLAGSVTVSTHAVPHKVVLPEQVTAHALEEQAWPLGQAMPQPPQLAASFLVLTQAEPHNEVPPEH